MRDRNPATHGTLPKTDVDQTCLLCDRNFCEKHKGKEEGVCEIYHETYYRKHHPQTPAIFPNLAAYEAEVRAMYAMGL